MEIKNPADAEGGCRAFSLGCYLLRITSEAGNPSFLPHPVSLSRGRGT